MFGGVVAWATGWIGSRSKEQAGLILAALVAPTLISALLDLPRPVKHVSRFFLGVATVPLSFCCSPRIAGWCESRSWVCILP
jgi:hypothetical protein